MESKVITSPDMIRLRSLTSRLDAKFLMHLSEHLDLAEELKAYLTPEELTELALNLPFDQAVVEVVWPSPSTRIVRVTEGILRKRLVAASQSAEERPFRPFLKSDVLAYCVLASQYAGSKYLTAYYNERKRASDDLKRFTQAIASFTRPDCPLLAKALKRHDGSDAPAISVQYPNEAPVDIVSRAIDSVVQDLQQFRRSDLGSPE